MYKIITLETFVVDGQGIEFDCELKTKLNYWMNTEKSKWAHKHSVEKPFIQYNHDHLNYQMVVTINAKLKLSDITLYYLLFN